jgi:citrate lyase subunit beta/citryl-CoA lyase
MRSALFVPGDRPDRLARAFSRGADAVIADLEDAVLPAGKGAALENVVDWIASLDSSSPPVWVRVNGPDARGPEIDLLADLPRLTGLVLPKAESADEVSEAYGRACQGRSGKPIAPMIESAAGLRELFAIAGGNGVAGLHLGEVDLAADLALEPGDDELELVSARSAVVLASRCAGLPPPLGPVSPVLDEPGWFSASTWRLRRLGFAGRACVHPAQVAVANSVFSSTPEEQAWALDVLTRHADGSGAFRDAAGRMVDEAVLRRARAILRVE